MLSDSVTGASAGSSDTSRACCVTGNAQPNRPQIVMAATIVAAPAAPPDCGADRQKRKADDQNRENRRDRALAVPMVRDIAAKQIAGKADDAENHQHGGEPIAGDAKRGPQENAEISIGGEWPAERERGQSEEFQHIGPARDREAFAEADGADAGEARQDDNDAGDRDHGERGDAEEGRAPIGGGGDAGFPLGTPTTMASVMPA